ncbi:MAG TPA: ligase-associated DNA damage response exonuclease [Hyphomicrobium sp.]|nr:ligase-associated DNA damage response exonuclease [Hyphomicrobium sp.]
MAASGVERWLYPTEKGLYCEPGDFFIDPSRAVPRAIITHGHGDHARPGHAAVLATPETIEIMKVRMGPDCARSFNAFAPGTAQRIGDVDVRLAPAGHILGSAQVVLEHDGQRAVVSGDYKRQPDPTCQPFELVPCDVFVTEATFALPVFRHEPPDSEVKRLLDSMRLNPERTHLVGVYGLGKCQRLIKLCRQAGYDAPIYLHGALAELTGLYQRLGVGLGEVRPIDPASRGKRDDYAGALVLCPPSAVDDRWSRRFNDPVSAFASGWMRIRGRIRQTGVELPLVISDHADWPELLDTIVATGAGEVWVTHGREDALVYQLSLMGRKARALALVGYEDEDE